MPVDRSPGASSDPFARTTLPVCVGACAGVVLLQRAASLPSAIACVLLACAAIALIVARDRLASPRAPFPGRVVASGSVAAFVAACALAVAVSAWRAHARLADALPAEWEGVDLAVVGIVDELPRLSAEGARFAFAVERVDTPGASVPSRLSLAWHAAGPSRDARAHDATGPPDDRDVPRVHAGERWRLTVRLLRPHGNVNPAGFDLEAWLLARGFRATGYVRDAAAAQRLDAFAGRAGDYVERARERVRDRIAAALPDAPYAGVLAALAVGDQRSIPEAQWLVFNRTGVGHLVSISGLHVTVFAAIVGGLAAWLLKRSTRTTSRWPARKPAAIVGVLAASGYVMLAGAEVPAMRTLAMLAVGAVGVVLGRPGTARTVWLLALLAVLAIDPWAVLAPGFWLSFGAVGLLVYACGSRIGGRPRSRPSRIAAAVAEATRTQHAVTIGLVPLALALFAQVSLVSPIANAVAIPVVTTVVVPLALVGIVVPVDVVWQLAHAVLALLMRLLEAMSSWPGAAWEQHAPLAWTVGVGLAGVVLWLAPRGLPGRALGAVALAPMALQTPPAPAPGTFTLVALDVGQGLAVAVRTHRHALLYDTGPRYSDVTDAGARVVAPYLRSAGTPSLDRLVVSHRDTDHSGGALSLLQTVPVRQLLSSLDDAHPIVLRQRERGDATRCVDGERWTWDGVQFAMLHPRADDYAVPGMRPNDLSCVLAIEASGRRVLITGDIEARSEYRLVADAAPALAADLLVVPHHGSRTSSTAPFVSAVGARDAIVTAGYRNRFGHPRPDVLARYDRAGTRILRTDRDGAITVELDGSRLHIERERWRVPRYWRTPVDDADPGDRP